MAGGWGRRHVDLLAACGGGMAVLALLLVVTGHPHAAVGAWAVALACTVVTAVACRAEHLAAREAAVDALVRAIAWKDQYTGEHTERVARYSVYIGEELGLSRRGLAALRRAALLHDVGKLAVPAELLNKPGRLTDEEFERVQCHASVCTDILGLVDVLRPSAGAAEGHHRRFDGAGYGSRTQSRHAAVVAVADAYDAMTSTRAYRRALRQEAAFAELRARSGSQFDPACVDALIRAVERRGERHGLGFERSNVVYSVEPPVMGVTECAH
ncbi:MAG TPA: HD domain-containing phosphohydrolase [Acidimicrobiales bacterium]|nr:HD domain-containing phosphohydrolase [Acidimicrobiales bacterium]